MKAFQTDLTERLAELRRQGLYRELRKLDCAQSPRVEIGGTTLLNFSSNDYLGLANDPAIKEAAVKAIEKYGAGSGASRLICGSLSPHHELDETIASFKGVEAALSFSSGYAAALGVICALLSKDDVIILDKLVHASSIDAARLSGAKIRVFAHNNLNELEDILKSSGQTTDGQRGRALIVTESVFSMDGDHAPLREIANLKEKYGAWLMVDEAHATGLYGAFRRGLSEELGISDRIEIQMGTLGKALGASGGYICGSRMLIDYLVNRARTFIFSTAPVPAAAAAASAGIQFVQSKAGAHRCETLWQRVAQLHTRLNTQSPTLRAAIIPIMLGDETRAVETAASLRAQGVLIPAIRYPTVPRGQARLRMTVSAAHTNADIQKIADALSVIRATHDQPAMAALGSGGDASQVSNRDALKASL
jgi:8-amino-7-oxononanoate synthase